MVPCKGHMNIRISGIDIPLSNESLIRVLRVGMKMPRCGLGTNA